MNVPFLPLLLSKRARRRLMDEMQQHVLRQCTKDPAMPLALQNLITSLVRATRHALKAAIAARDRQV